MTPTEQPKPNQPTPNHFFPHQEKEILGALTYGSYAANRDLGMSPEAYGKMMGWDIEKMQLYESAYQANMETERENARYDKLLEDLGLKPIK